MTPNLLIVGAPRSGTTFLFSMLGKHPAIFAPAVKEPHFHLADRWPLNGPEGGEFTRPLADYLQGRRRSVWGGLLTEPNDYAALYQDGADAPWRMEATPNYFAEGGWMAQRLKERLGADIRIVIALRDPVERAYSHHRLFQSLGWENLPFADAMAAAPERREKGWAPTWDYPRYSQYAGPLAQWQSVFGDRVKVVSFDDLTWQPRAVIEDIQHWLGLDPCFDPNAAQRNGAPPGTAKDLADAERAIVANGRLDLAKERAAVAAASADRFAPPLVTVGMPVLNGEKTVEAALESLSAQTYANLRIVVCDNDSDDGTCAIVSRMAARDQRITLQKFNTRADIQTSYKRALDTATGSYFMFAPCDDSWEPGFIAAAVRRMQLDPGISVCCGRIELVRDDETTFLSNGVQDISGAPDKRWRAALMQTVDASRLYGLLRVSALADLIPDVAPEGWDHYSAAKLALRGDVAALDTIAMKRHQTPDEHYRKHIMKQERTFLRQVFYLRHVRRLFIDDPAFNTASIGARLTLWGYVLQYSYLPLMEHKRLYKRFSKFGRLLGRMGQKVPF